MKDADLGVYEVCPCCGHDPAEAVRVVSQLREKIYSLREKLRAREDPFNAQLSDYASTTINAVHVAHEEVIRALTADISALREANRWIPVGERLPEGDCDPVYRYEDEHNWTEDYFCRIEFDGSIVFDAAVFDVKKSKWFRVDYDGSPIELNVTHWHLLPAPIERQTK